MKNLLLEVQNYSWSQLERCYSQEVQLNDLERIHYEIQEALEENEINYIKYFQDRIRFYYSNGREEQFIELSLYGFSSKVQEPIYDRYTGIWRHSDYCLWY